MHIFLQLQSLWSSYVFPRFRCLCLLWVSQFLNFYSILKVSKNCCNRYKIYLLNWNLIQVLLPNKTKKKRGNNRIGERNRIKDFSLSSLIKCFFLMLWTEKYRCYFSLVINYIEWSKGFVLLVLWLLEVCILSKNSM